jgi:hypothetical protein
MNRNARNLQEARARYGKPFAHEVKVGRIRPKSFLLQHLESLSRSREDPVVNLVRRSK